MTPPQDMAATAIAPGCRDAELARGPDVVVVGSGPAGLGAATELRRRGAGRVTVLERQPVAGGIPRHCGHSPYGMREFGRVLLGPAYARRLAETAVAEGVDLRTGQSVLSIGEGPAVTVASHEGVRTLRPDAVILATGARETTRAAALVSGGRTSGIMNTAALQDMIHLKGRVPFRRPVILGSELVTNSAILTCRLHGIRPVALVEEAERPILRAPMSWFPGLTGLRTYLGATVLDVEGESRVEAVTIETRDGATVRLDCDGLLLTGRFVPEGTAAQASGIALDPGTKGPAVDTMGRTSMAGVYAAGNVLRGVETAGWSWQEGVRVARAVIADRRTGDVPVVRLEAGRGVARIVPQRLSTGAGDDAFGDVQVRVRERIRGRLVARQGDREIWSRRLNSGPERRVLMPVAALRAAADASGPVRISAEAW